MNARNLRKTYRLGRGNVVQALRGVDFSIDAGEMVAVMGPSGSGKSTLMHVLGMLHKPDLGDGPRPEVVFDGRDVTTLSDGRRTALRAHEIGFVFQDFNLVSTLTALENVILAREYAGAGGPAGKRAALEALAAVGLTERADHRPAELSGGEQQRVAIARALVNRPRLVLADEPTGNLDSERSDEIMSLLSRFNRDEGQTFVLVTHEAEIGAACGRVVHMRDGLVQGISANDPAFRSARAASGSDDSGSARP